MDTGHSNSRETNQRQTPKTDSSQIDPNRIESNRINHVAGNSTFDVNRPTGQPFRQARVHEKKDHFSIWSPRDGDRVVVPADVLRVCKLVCGGEPGVAQQEVGPHLA